MDWLLPSVLLGALAFAAVGRSLESGTWEGFVSFGGEFSDFRPCGSKEIWWLKGSGYDEELPELRKKYQELAEPYEQVYARLRGDVTKKGQYGQLGTYQRVFYVEEILEIRHKREEDCA